MENSLQCVFGWKSRHDEAHGRSPALGGKVLHPERAFHGRSGYTMSLTNTDPDKTARFPVFDWPSIEVPAVRFPLERHRAEVEAAEQRARELAKAVFAAHPHDIACFIAEPVQGKGGDNHMRPEFLRYPHAGDNARGLGLMCAFDAPDPHSRNTVVTRVREEHKVLLLPSGERSVRVRPALTVMEEELGLALRALEFGPSTMPSAVS